MIQIHHCDNLELLQSQSDESIDLIYCDILYGTGRNFKDYQDLKPKREIIEEHYIPRLKQMHRVLKPTGSIYLQMDTRINHWLRCIMDNVFGYDNFRNEIIWSKGFNGTESKLLFQKTHDNILLYSKTKIFIWNNVYQKHKDNYYKRKNKHDEKGYYQEVKRYKKDRSIYYGKCYEQPKKCDDVFEDIRLLPSNAKERIGYDTQKPKALIERIIKASSNEGDTVADYYLGSGTTASVCKDLNRNFIGCDISKKAVDISISRLN